MSIVENINIVEGKVYRINPGYMSKFDELVKAYSQYGGGVEGEKFILGKAFSNAYEFYIYAFFLGLVKDRRLDFSEGEKKVTFWEIVNWKPREVVDYLLASAMPKSGFDMVGIEHMGIEAVDEQIRKLRVCIEGYANGGFQIVSETLDEDLAGAEDHMFFIRLLS